MNEAKMKAYEEENRRVEEVRDMTDEPKINLPDPPEGYRWEYRGMGVRFKDVCAFAHEDDEHASVGMEAQGFDNLHYWKAVASENTAEQKLQIAISTLEQARGWPPADRALKQIL